MDFALPGVMIRHQRLKKQRHRMHPDVGRDVADPQATLRIPFVTVRQPVLAHRFAIEGVELLVNRVYLLGGTIREVVQSKESAAPDLRIVRGAAQHLFILPFPIESNWAGSSSKARW
ncbi:hypothetical protein G6F32_015751 [Rhizopus arrhizus]|nr:hypothetical protein G6F32_015751 [Rhizopus arrhizus]